MIVLQGFPYARATTNPYLVMLAQSLRELPSVEVLNFNWKTALFGRFDVYHTHWPENLGQGRTTLRELVRQALTLMFLLRLRIMKIPLVRTLHNVDRPAGLNARQKLLLDLIDKWTSFYFTLNNHTNVPLGVESQQIPHGHYVDWFSRFDLSSTTRNQIAFVGLIRKYKGIEHLIEVFHEMKDPDLKLVISGNPTSQAISDTISSLAGRDSRIKLNMKFLSEAEFASRITEAELIVLPYQFMHNSGSTLAAVSLGRPVLVPDNQVNLELSREVGAGWIHLYKGEISAKDIQNTLDSIRINPPIFPPKLDDRNWSSAGELHLSGYLKAQKHVRTSNRRAVK